ncbi:TetR/AcrR family transcriptional regulator [Kibdelosporangium phytohabitans]|uniref:TetR family transcriptional regulator n=1 Tax=Kibdelosporangium phytohabitans TaxID=860235 RepID=A0A0N9I267_9PSEU|nr:TetR/AcrR family transcriptional regulator [Kibdelosporangium phytohabitans]ALG08808.1 TetR family transcriptional regulator [Kibdelosporangium phytohabitans]MBE1470052.1 AcrR family transcriptional regulator [Kibdelosporangium phytohabitans]
MSQTTARRVRLAAIELFATRGFHGTGIRDLAEAAGLSSATLYHYMGTKEDLLVSIMRASLDRLVAAARQVTADVPDPLGRVTNLVALHVYTHAEQQLETRVVDGEIRALSPQRRPGIIALRDEYEACWQTAIDDGCDRGLLRPSSRSVARLALLEMCSGISRWYSPTGPFTLDELAERYIEMSLGLLGAPGPAAKPDLGPVRAIVAANWPD